VETLPQRRRRRTACKAVGATCGLPFVALSPGGRPPDPLGAVRLPPCALLSAEAKASSVARPLGRLTQMRSMSTVPYPWARRFRRVARFCQRGSKSGIDDPMACQYPEAVGVRRGPPPAFVGRHVQGYVQRILNRDQQAHSDGVLSIRVQFERLEVVGPAVVACGSRAPQGSEFPENYAPIGHDAVLP